MSEPVAGRDLAWLERRRAELFGLISQAGDFRRGALNAVWRKCGKPNCACARPGHRGHGPQWNLTRRVGGKTVNVHLKPGPELEKVRREVAEHQRFADLVEEVTAVSEAICAARPAAGPAASPPAEGEGGAPDRPGRDRRRGGDGPGRAGRWDARLGRGAGGAGGGDARRAGRVRRAAAGSGAGRPRGWVCRPARQVRQRPPGGLRRPAAQGRHHGAGAGTGDAGLVPLPGLRARLRATG